MMNSQNSSHRNQVNFHRIMVLLIILTIGSLLHYSFGTYYAATNVAPHVVGADDAYISYRYGWNLVHSKILSWNESGFRKTEGFTNPLWVYVSALWSLFENKDLVYPGMVAFSILVTVALVTRLSLLILNNDNLPNNLIGIFLLCASPILWLHSTSGLESSVFGVGIGLLAYFAITRDKIQKSDIWFGNILAIFLIFLRSDGFAYLTVLLIGLIPGRLKNWRMILPGAVIGFITLMLWRKINFGHSLPNTGVAKLNFDVSARLGPGILLFLKSMSNGGIVFLIIGLLGMLSMPNNQRLPAFITVGGWSSYYIYIGGDLFLERHLIGIMVLCAAISSYFFSRLLRDKRGWILTAFLFAGLYTPFYLRDSRFLYNQVRSNDSWILIGKEMALNRELYGTVVVFPAGKIPFFAGGDFVDELGLNDPELALIRRPRFIPGHSSGDLEKALDIAKHSSITYSYLGFNLSLTDKNVKDVLLWADNSSSSGEVHHELSMRQYEILSKAKPFEYTLLFRGK